MSKDNILRDFFLKVKLITRTKRKQIWLVRNQLDGEMYVAKLQFLTDIEANKKNSNRNILHEGKFMQASQGYTGIPFLNWAGKDQTMGISMIIVQKLGLTIEKQFKQLDCKFSLKTVCLLGIEMFKLIFSYHDRGYVHGNIKLSAFQFGVGHKSYILYFNDLLESVIFTKKGKHIKKELAKNKVKLHPFMSLDRLQGYESCRRDDVESILLILVYLMKGALPWSSLFEIIQKLEKSQNEFEVESSAYSKDHSISKEVTNEQTLKFGKKSYDFDAKYTQFLHKIMNKIDKTSMEEICQGLPKQILRMLQQCRSLEYQSRPDYNYYIRSLRKILAQNNEFEDGVYDWMLNNNQRYTIAKNAKISQLLIRFPLQKQLLDKIYYPFQGSIQLI